MLHSIVYHNPVFSFSTCFSVFQKTRDLVFSFSPLLRGKLTNWKMILFFAGLTDFTLLPIFGINALDIRKEGE
jgi:hypothetical protein